MVNNIHPVIKYLQISKKVKERDKNTGRNDVTVRKET